MFDIEGQLLDYKEVDFNLASGLRRAGEPVHTMWLRITVDRKLVIHDAAAATDAMPYAGFCETITGEYRKLVGLHIGPGFKDKLRHLLGGTHGCTHLTELVNTVATTAFQTLAGAGAQDPQRKPFQLDRCHALKSSGPAVARYYPRWFSGHRE